MNGFFGSPVYGGYGQEFMPMYGQGGNVPAFNLGYPGCGPQQPLIIPPTQKIFSSYTGKYVGMGGVPFGTICDAPLGDPKYGKPFHVIEKDCVGNFMIHGQGNK